MKKLYAIALICFIFGVIKGQSTKPGELDEKTLQEMFGISNTHPTTPYGENFVIVDTDVCELFSNGEMKIFDIESGQQIDKNLKTDFRIDFVTKDKDNSPLVYTVTGKLMKLNLKKLLWEDVTPPHFKKCFGFATNSKGKRFEMVVNGINDLATGQVYTPGKEFCFSEYRLNGGAFDGWEERSGMGFFMDNKDNLWFRVSYGEWGSDTFVFNTTTHRFIKPKGEMCNIINTVFEGDGNVYCNGAGAKSQPFAEMGFFARVDFTPNDTTGFSISCKTIYNTLDNQSEADAAESDDNMVSPTFNPLDKKIYFFCGYGLFRGDPLKSLANISHWEKVKKFKLQAQNVQPRIKNILSDIEKEIDTPRGYNTSLPYGMHQMAFANDGKLVFMSGHDGLGVFDGRKITMLDTSSSY
jgi:hypothetical protein